MNSITVAVFCGLGLFVLGTLFSKSAFLVNFYRKKDVVALSRTHEKALRISKIALTFTLLSPIPLGLFFDTYKSGEAVQVLLPVAILLVMASAEVFWMGRRVSSLTEDLLKAAEHVGSASRGTEGSGGSESSNP